MNSLLEEWVLRNTVGEACKRREGGCIELCCWELVEGEGVFGE